MRKIIQVSSKKNSMQWFSFSMIAILLISFLMIAIYPSLSDTHRVNSIELNCDLSKDIEVSDAEKDITEESINLFYFEITKVNLQKTSSELKRSHTVFSIPSVYYDIHILPPELLFG